MGETPDYARFNAQATVFPVTDLGELAARLGSPITFDRRGDVVWWDDFEWTLNKWVVEAVGTGAAGAVSSAKARNGRMSCLLTGGSDGAHSAAIRHQEPFPVVGSFGLECSFGLGGDISAFRIQMTLYDGSQSHDAYVQWSDIANTLSYLDAAGGVTIFASGVDLLLGDPVFHTAKLVYNLTTARYVRFLLDSSEYDLSGIAGLDAAAATLPYLQIRLTLLSRNGSNDTCYVDDVILTQNEPA